MNLQGTLRENSGIQHPEPDKALNSYGKHRGQIEDDSISISLLPVKIKAYEKYKILTVLQGLAQIQRIGNTQYFRFGTRAGQRNFYCSMDKP